MDNLKFKKGLEQNLPKELEKDTFYISTDSKKIRLNDAVWEDSDNIKNIINENEKVTANALNSLNDKLKILQSTYITYNELKTLYENSKLVVGAQYCITDYITTTSQLNTRSANHQFDIIVEAISPNVLSEEATACLHNGDTYFSHSNLTSWKLNYSLNNDTTRFSWADEVNGKGVIYYMKDEFGNEAPYDFKNIQFKRSSEWLNENNDWKNAVLSTFNGTELWLYTFSYYDISLGIIDDSLTVYPTAPQHYAYNNIIKEYYRINDGKLELNNIVFISTSESPYHNNINYGCNNLIFGNNCYNNTLGVHANNNIIGNNFYLNNIGSGFKNNKIYNTNQNAKVYSNIFLNDCQNNVFPRQFISNICGDNFIGNDFVTQTSYANLGLVTNCNFGNSFAYNVGMPYKLSNIEILNNTLLFKQSNLGNWNEIILNNGKTITSYLQDLGTILGSFKLRIGVNEYGQYFAHDVDTDGVYRLGEFSTFDNAMNAAAIANVAGNAKITKMLFTSGNNNGIIEQFVHSNQSTQELTWNGGFRMRIITFTDTTRTEVSNISDWHWSKPTELYYDISQHKIALTRFNDGRNWGLSGCFGAVEIPEATNNNAGLLSPNEKQIFAHFKHLGNFALSSDAENEAAKIENLDKKITNLFYTVNNESTGVIEQCFSNNEIYQYLVLDGIKYVRKIIVENNEVKEINGWQNINNADKITGLYYWPSTRQLCLTNIFNQSWGTTILPLATEESDGIMSKEDKVNVDRVNEFVYDLGVITQDTNGTAWKNMLKRAAEVANNQNIGIITFKLDDNWDKNKNGVIEQQVGKTTTIQTLKWDNCESIRYITFADENKTTPQNPNQDFTHARTMPTHLYYDGNSKNLSFRQISANGSYVNGLNRSADFGTITFPVATNTISSVVKLGDDYTQTVNDTALSLQGANNLFNAINENVNVINQIINENEEVTANALVLLNDNYEEVKNELDNLTVDSLIHITYDELVTLRNNAELIGGMKYRIIDYITITSQLNTQSANHQFDIIVEALSEDTLSENAKACLHDGDTYFSENNAKLEAWELKYCLDNDNSRFAWIDNLSIVDSTNISIVDSLITNNEFNNPFLPDYYIYIDTAGNKFNEYITDDTGEEGRNGDYFFEYRRETSPDGLENQLCIYKNDINNEDYIEGGIEEGIDYADKFFYWGTEEVDGILYDKWRKCESNTIWGIGENKDNVYILTQRITTGEINLVEDNNGKGVIYYMKDEFNNECPYDFKNIQFYREEQNNRYLFTFSWVNENEDVEDLTLRQDLLSDDGTAYGTHDNIIKIYYNWNRQQLNDVTFVSSYLHDSGLFYGCYSNSLGNDCYSNSFGNNCNSNSLGNECSHNSFGDGCNSNSLGNGCYSNSLGNDCYFNSFCNGCHSNSFGDGCYSNSLGNDCYSNSLGDNCYFNSFCNGCNTNGFSDDCSHNSFGNACYSNSLGNNCISNNFGNGCYSNILGNNCNSNSFGNNCTSNRFGNRCNSNSFGNGCHSNSFGNGCKNNSFGDSCYYNSFANDCISNSLGNNCNNNSFGDDCNSNSLGNTCYVIRLGDNCRNNKFGNNCLRVKFTLRGDDLAPNIRNNQLGNSCSNLNIDVCYGDSNEYLQNFVISSGLSNANINLIDFEDYNRDYETHIARNSKGEIKIYCEADLIG